MSEAPLDLSAVDQIIAGSVSEPTDQCYRERAILEQLLTHVRALRTALHDLQAAHQAADWALTSGAVDASEQEAARVLLGTADERAAAVLAEAVEGRWRHD